MGTDRIARTSKARAAVTIAGALAATGMLAAPAPVTAAPAAAPAAGATPPPTATAEPAAAKPKGKEKDPSGLDTAAIEELTGVKGSLDAKEGVFKVSLPRSDIKAFARGVRLTPAMGLTAWAAFTRAGPHAMVMGDIVLLEDQVNPVMSTALDSGLEVTALHNHFFWDTPKVMFMHIGGMGDQKALAAAVGKVFARLTETAAVQGEPPRADIDPAQTRLGPAKIEAVLGYKGDLKDGVYKVVVGRTTRMTTMGGQAAGKQMGVNTWAAFAGSDDKAVVDGDFAMQESELQPVLKALRAGGIDILAIHNHMTGESPRIVFLHYWGIGPTESLARTLKSALDKTKHSPPH